MVLESWYDTKRVVQRYSRSSRHNSREFPTGCCWAPIPQKAAEEVLEAWYYTRHWRRVVLEAWYYTRHWCRSVPGGLVLHQGGWDRSDPRGGNWIPGNSRLCSSVQIPPECGDDWLNTNGCEGHCHQYQGSVGDGSDWYTVFKVHTGSLTFTLFILWSLF